MRQLSIVILTFTVLAFCLVEFDSKALIPKICPIDNTLSCFPGGTLTDLGNACEMWSSNMLWAQIMFLNI